MNTNPATHTTTYPAYPTHPAINQPLSTYTPSTTLTKTSTSAPQRPQHNSTTYNNGTISLFAMNTINNAFNKLSLSKLNTNTPSSTVSSYSPYSPCTPTTTITSYIPSKINKPTGDLIILDFDDTIFPTSVLSTYVHNN
eukprot:522704_1